MKTVLKLNIVFVFILSGFILATPVNNGLQKKSPEGYKLSTNQIHQRNYSVEEFICFDGIDQLDYKSQTKFINSFIDTPETFGGFKKYFSTQTLLPDIRTGQRFSRKLII